MSHHADAEALREAFVIMDATDEWMAAQRIGDRGRMDRATRIAEEARNRLRSLGYGWIADAMGAEDTPTQKLAFLGRLRAQLEADGSFSQAGSSAPVFVPVTESARAPADRAPAERVAATVSSLIGGVVSGLGLSRVAEEAAGTLSGLVSRLGAVLVRWAPLVLGAFLVSRVVRASVRLGPLRAGTR